MLPQKNFVFRGSLRSFLALVVDALTYVIRPVARGGSRGSDEPPFFARQSAKRELTIRIMSCYATPSRIDLYMYYIIPSVDVDLAITIDRIAPA